MVKVFITKEELGSTWNSKHFKNREEVKTEIRDCDQFAARALRWNPTKEE